ncbi:MAG: hypothetical protein GWP18_03155 [Proteobacteria bacterium]|nr:hypothetical protein [Pseudomonadota bacterium]
MLAQLAAAHPQIVASGGDVIGVAPAASIQARHLMKTSIPFDLFMDKPHALSKRIELGEQSLWHFLFSLKGWWNYLKSFARNRRQGKITQGYRSLPAIMVVNRSGDVMYLHLGTGLADYPALSDVLAELDTSLG